MDDSLLILIAIFGIALLLATQGYGFMMQGRALIDPEQRAKNGARLIYTGLALIMAGTLVALTVVAMMLLQKTV